MNRSPKAHGRHRATSGVTAAALALAALLAACDSTTTRPDGEETTTMAVRWRIEGRVDEGEDLSGIAVNGLRHGLLASDETNFAQLVTLRGERVMAVGKRVLLARGTDELDLEAVAREGSFFYLVGSHGLSRKKGRLQLSRFQLFRLDLDEKTGVPKGWDGSGIPGSVHVTSLRDLIRNDPVVGEFAEKRVQDNGVGVEGLAVRDGRLYVGFRTPSLAAGAPVMVLDVGAVFGGSPTATTQVVAVGKGRGIRDLAAVSDGLLVLSGPAGKNDGSGFAIHWWSGSGSAARHLRDLPSPDGARPEALLVLEETKEGYEVLILHDGVDGGLPTQYGIKP